MSINQGGAARQDLSAVFAVRDTALECPQGLQAFNQPFIGHHDGSHRAWVDQALGSIKGDHIPFIENPAPQMHGTRR
ncbi:MAG: hypothetical protein ABI606_04585, partial [Rhodoferax sp.]